MYLRSKALACLAIGGLALPASSVAASAQELALSWQQSVAHVLSYGDTNTIGTGFLVETETPGLQLFITAHHVVRNRDSLLVTFGIYDSTGSRREWPMTVHLFKAGKRNYFVSDTLFDCVWIPIIESRQHHSVMPEGFSRWFLKRDVFTRPEDLYPGIPVVIPGYPGGLSGDQKTPLFRRGIIAGVSLERRMIYVDANIFPGSSGSPVFLDPTSPFAKGIRGSCIGILVDAKYGMMPNAIGTDTTKENIGIGVVIPSDVFIPSLELFDRETQD